MSLSPFDSFQSRFVTYLLNCPRKLSTAFNINSFLKFQTKFYNEVLFVRRRDLLLFPTLNWNESFCLRFKQNKLQFTTKNYVSVFVL